MDYEHPDQKVFYNCKVAIYDSSQRLLGTSYYQAYRPDPRYIKDYDLMDENEESRITRTSISELGGGVYYIIAESKEVI